MTSSQEWPSSASSRCFPDVHAGIYATARSGNSTTGPASAAESILALTDTNLPRWQRWTGLGLDDIGRVARMLWLHRSALDAELSGRWERADFFHRAFRRALEGLWHSDRAWNALSQHLTSQHDDTWCADGNRLRGRLMKELFIDVARALFEGRKQGNETLSPDDRAFVHASQLDKLLEIASLPEPESYELRAALAEPAIAAWLKAGDTEHAIAVCEELLRRHPQRVEYQDRVVRIRFETTVTRLADSSLAKGEEDGARIVGTGIDQLERLLSRWPDNPMVYESLAVLEQIHAVKLANCGRLADGLLAVERSLAYQPLSDDSMAVREQLRQAMVGLQAQMKEVSAQVGAQPGASLNAEGIRLQKEATRGFGPAEGFASSARKSEVESGLARARAIQFWRSCGLPLDAHDVAERSRTLMDSVASLFDEPPTDRVSLSARIDALTSGVEELDDAHRDKLVEWFAERLGIEPQAPASSCRPRSPAVSPRLEFHTRARVSSSPPLGMWLFSTIDLPAKAFAVFAMLALATSLTLGSFELHERGERSDAYESLLEAAQRDGPGAVYALASEFLATAPASADPRRVHAETLRGQAEDAPDRLERDAAYDALLKAARDGDAMSVPSLADAFLAIPVSSGGDPRTDRVERLRSEAIELPNRLRRERAYAELERATDSRDTVAAMNAAERYLQAPPVHSDDPRRALVLKRYSKAFTSWFTGLVGEIDTGSMARIERYRALALGKV